ncbi:MAG: SurA N-terminal domain-containing protein [Kiritimatiellae bacterium]|nr:SurA N-terminal domain-containing protein [Kiritimatiellia bacterium]
MIRCWVGLGIVILTLGCERRPVGPQSVFSAKSKTVLVNVNGDDITVGDYRRRYDLERAIFRYTKSDLTEEELKSQTARFMNSREPQIIAELINQLLIRQYMRGAQLKLPDDVSNAVVAGELRKFKHNGTLGAFAERLGMDADYLRDQLLAAERVAFSRDAYGNGPFTVTEKEIDEGLERMDRYHDFAVASNTVTYATASNVLHAIRAGMDFIAAGKKYGAYRPEEAEQWMSFSPDEIGNPYLKTWAFSAPVGSVGGPFDLEDGLSIVKILDRQDGTMVESVVSEKVAEVTLSRITFYMLVPDPEPHTREHVREALIRWKGNNAQKALFQKLHDDMRLLYPSGTNFVFEGGKP